MYQLPTPPPSEVFDIGVILDHPIFGILFFFIGMFIFYKFLKLALKYTVRAKSDYN